MERALIRKPEPAQRGKLLLRKIVPVMLEEENILLYPNRNLPRACIVGILEQFRKDMTRTLYLPEELLPWTSKFGVLLQLFPALKCPLANVLKKCWRIAFHGTSLHSDSPIESVSLFQSRDL
jgi:hypothetical protein